MKSHEAAKVRELVSYVPLVDRASAEPQSASGAGQSASGAGLLRASKPVYQVVDGLTVRRGRSPAEKAPREDGLKFRENRNARMLRLENKRLRKQLVEILRRGDRGSNEPAAADQFADDLAWADARIKAANGSIAADPVRDFIASASPEELRELVERADAERARVLSESIAKARGSK